MSCTHKRNRSWFRSLNQFSRRSKSPRKRDRTQGLSLESLEPRQLLSANELTVLNATAPDQDPSPVGEFAPSDAADSSQNAGLAPLNLTGGEIIYAHTSEELVTALANAEFGDTIILDAGKTYVGNFILDNADKINSTGEFITIRGSAQDKLPNGRVSPADADYMPRLVSRTIQPVIDAQFGAHHYRIEGLEITSDYLDPTNKLTPDLRTLVRLGFNQALSGEEQYPTNADELVDHIVLNQNYIHGTDTTVVKEGINANGSNITVSNSYISEIHTQGDADATAILGYVGGSGYMIENNYLESSGENILFGGQYPALPTEDAPHEPVSLDLSIVPHDIVIRGNKISKPNTWRQGHEDFAGLPWSVKNLIEFKSGHHVLIEGNEIDGSWIQADQFGFAILLTPINSAVHDIEIRNNVIKNTERLISLAPKYNDLYNITIENNLVYDLGKQVVDIDIEFYSPDLSELQVSTELHDILIQNNTMLFGERATSDGTGNIWFKMDNGYSSVNPNGDYRAHNLTVKDNIVGGGLYGIHGGGSYLPGLQKYFDNFEFSGNAVVNPGFYEQESWWTSSPWAHYLINDAMKSEPLGETEFYENFVESNDQNEVINFYGDFALYETYSDAGFTDPSFNAPEDFRIVNPDSFLSTNGGKGVDIDKLLSAVDHSPKILSIEANGQASRTVSVPTSSELGVHTIVVKFSEAMNFDYQDVTVNPVTFVDGAEVIRDPIPLSSLYVFGDGTDTMVITFEPGTIVNSWAKVTLHSDGITDMGFIDSLGNPVKGKALDGEADPDGTGQNYISDASLDLPSGDGTAGGDATFYVGNLVGDVDRTGTVSAGDAVDWAANYGATNASEDMGDIDGDGLVDTSDYALLVAHNGNVLSPLPNRTDILPRVTRVVSNGLSSRTLSTPTSGTRGLQTIEVDFSETVHFDPSAISVHLVTFPGGIETLGDSVPMTVTGSGSTQMTLTFADDSVVNSWIKVVIDDGGVVDSNGNALDGDAPTDGSALGYLFDSTLDLPSGDGIAGGDAVFYVGNLVGDVDRDGAVTLEDLNIAQSNYTDPNGQTYTQFYEKGHPTYTVDSFSKSADQGDIDEDGDVDIDDILRIFASQATIDELPGTQLEPSLPLDSNSEVSSPVSGSLLSRHRATAIVAEEVPSDSTNLLTVSAFTLAPEVTVDPVDDVASATTIPLIVNTSPAPLVPDTLTAIDIHFETLATEDESALATEPESPLLEDLKIEIRVDPAIHDSFFDAQSDEDDERDRRRKKRRLRRRA